MRAAAVEISPKDVSRSSERFSSKNGIARYARRHWRQNTVKAVQTQWDLTEGEAKGVVYGHASQTTLDKIYQHPRGGWPVALYVLAVVIGADLADFLRKDRERVAHEAEQEQQRQAHRAVVERTLRGRFLRVVGGGGAGDAD